MAEFSIIRNYCQGIGPKHRSTRIDIGDDAAVFEPPQDMDIAVSTDTMVTGVHFLPDTAPSHLAHKILAVNCSDMAAMGAIPKYATLALTMPQVDEPWLAEFSAALMTQAERFKVQLIGGDTSSGNLTLSCTIIGLLDKFKVLSRASARPGSDVYVSGSVGDAALALAHLQNQINLPKTDAETLTLAHYRPEPRVELGQGLLNIADACIDVSDGLVADLGHICQQSEVSIQIELDAIPLSEAYLNFQNSYSNSDQAANSLDYALYGGDDYELAFTARADRRGEIKALSEELGLRLTKIGIATSAQEHSVMLARGDKLYRPQTHAGYQHFL